MQARAIATGPGVARNEARSRSDLRISALGSGSDYSAFLQHAGVPTLNLSFSGLDDNDGIYHSIYDDYYHFTKFLDTDFAYGRVLAQTVGSLVIRLADAQVLPFQFTSLADTVQTYVAELQALLKNKQSEVKELNRQIEEGVFTAIADPRRGLRAPVVESIPPSINFAPLENAATALTQAAERYKNSLEAARSNLTPEAIRTLNKGLIQSERNLTDAAGLPRRSWYRHMLYAPGFYTGYGVKTMPGVREALEQRDYAEAEREVVRVAEALMREAQLIDGLTKLLDPPQK
jgi:N-acetylated-alpha-linked acidic dipeptidase